jgi:hypothetical protein
MGNVWPTLFFYLYHGQCMANSILLPLSWAMYGQLYSSTSIMGNVWPTIFFYLYHGQCMANSILLPLSWAMYGQLYSSTSIMGNVWPTLFFYKKCLVTSSCFMVIEKSRGSLCCKGYFDGCKFFNFSRINLLKNVYSNPSLTRPPDLQRKCVFIRGVAFSGRDIIRGGLIYIFCIFSIRIKFWLHIISWQLSFITFDYIQL